MLKVLSFADDATGALEVGAHLADAGLEAEVSIRGLLCRSATGLVVDTETRHSSASDAKARLLSLAAEARRRGIDYIYKKTDSTLRGNIAAEFEALREAFPERPIVYAPAFPEMGRTVRKGHLYVHGVPVEESSFARDRLNPSREGSIPALLGGDVVTVTSGQELAAVIDSGASVVVCDSETAADVEQIAAAVVGLGRPYLAAGPGGFVSAWLRRLRLAHRHRRALVAWRRCLVVNGSVHPVSREQVARSGLPLHRLGEESATAHEVGRSGWVCLTTCGSQPGAAEDIADLLAASARKVCEKEQVNGLVVFGGDTTFAVLEAFGADSVISSGELLRGVPVSIMPEGRGLVTKAGGFGGPDMLRLIREHLERGT